MEHTKISRLVKIKVWAKVSVKLGFGELYNAVDEMHEVICGGRLSSASPCTKKMDKAALYSLTAGINDNTEEPGSTTFPLLPSDGTAIQLCLIWHDYNIKHHINVM